LNHFALFLKAYFTKFPWNFDLDVFAKHRRAVELACLDVKGCSLLDGAEAGDAEGLTGLGDGVDPAADVLELLAAAGVLLLGDESAVLVDHEVALGQARFVLQARTVPYLAAASTDANTTGHIELLS
jgi:hypothetical protein